MNNKQNKTNYEGVQKEWSQTVGVVTAPEDALTISGTAKRRSDCDSAGNSNTSLGIHG